MVAKHDELVTPAVTHLARVTS